MEIKIDTKLRDAIDRLADRVDNGHLLAGFCQLGSMSELLEAASSKIEEMKLQIRVLSKAVVDQIHPTDNIVQGELLRAFLFPKLKV